MRANCRLKERAKIMLCTYCKKNPATIQMQQLGNSGINISICQECILKMLPPNFASSFEGMLNDFTGQPGAFQLPMLNIPINIPANMIMQPAEQKQNTSEALGVSLKCTCCGLMKEELDKTAKFGCDVCYDIFSDFIENFLKKSHGTIKHTGKLPRRKGADIQLEQRTSNLRSLLKSAIEAENYEEAARLRDEIRAMEVS